GCSPVSCAGRLVVTAPGCPRSYALSLHAALPISLVEIRSAEFRERGYVMMVEVCNGTTAGGDYRFAPHADPADGQLDVCLVRRRSEEHTSELQSRVDLVFRLLLEKKQKHEQALPA